MSHHKTPPHSFAKAQRAWNDPVSPPARKPVYLPLPPRPPGNLYLDLETILPGVTKRIDINPKLVFHSVGDTGGIHGTETQESLAKVMQAQIAAADPPAFLYHLGDLVYFNGQSDGYVHQFYEPYQNLNYPIVAIPGNHDGDTRTRSGDDRTSEPSLTGFMGNFCARSPSHFFKHRTTMTQPYCYWALKTPLCVIIGLYSNVDGLLDAPGTSFQQDWLEKALIDSLFAPKLPVIIALHHPPYSMDTSHGGYGAVGEALNAAFDKTAVKPMMVLSGHVHNYQRFDVDGVPYVIAGAGGYANTYKALHKLATQHYDSGVYAELPIQTTEPGVSLRAYNDLSPGFLRISLEKEPANGCTLHVEYWTVPFGSDQATIDDKFETKWAT